MGRGGIGEENMLRALKIMDWYMKLLNPLSTEVWLSLINKLSESLLKESSSFYKTKAAFTSDFFDSLGTSWDDGISPEEETFRLCSTCMYNVTYNWWDGLYIMNIVKELCC